MKCRGTSGPSSVATHRLSAAISASESLRPGIQEGGDLDPHVGVVVEPGEGVEHRREVRAALVHVEVVGEGLEVDIGGVHRGEEVAPGVGVDVAGGDRHVGNALRAAGEGGVDGVLGEITGSL